MILRVGLTGGIASGKSTVVRMLAGLGCITVDADQIVARLYRPGERGHEAIVRTYGEAVLLPDGEIDRQKLADVAFAAPEEARKLNALIHPIVIEEQARIFREAEERGEDAILIMEATLLLEAGGKARYDKIVVVDVEPDVQIARGIGRGMTREEVKRRMANQMPREQRLAAADYVINNSGNEQSALAGATRVYDLLRRDLETKKRKSPEVAPGATT
ncbi:MAG TPA: dephospho-CoA kinase [Thermoanaerobaculia bacterium]|nr:dephospho-CoA kinase [Thermoanaerobaculia bacterium]